MNRTVVIKLKVVGPDAGEVKRIVDRMLDNGEIQDAVFDAALEGENFDIDDAFVSEEP